jgi:uncharacterized RDD family membrane protein YckC
VITRWIGRCLARTRFAKKAIEEQADLSAFKKPPSPRLVAGLILIGLSFVVCWPAIAVAAYLAVHLDEPLIFVIGAPSLYVFSWLVWGAGMLITGTENYKYARIFLRWLVRRWVERHAGEPGSES